MNDIINSSIWEEKDPKVHMRYDNRHFAISASRRFFSGLVLYSLVSSLFLFVMGILLYIFAPAVYDKIAESSALTLIINSAGMYLIGTAALCLTVKGTPVRKREKKKFGIENIIILFAIGQFFTVAGNLLGRLVTLIISMLLGVNTSVDLNGTLEAIPLWCLFLIVVIIGPIFEELVFRKLMIDRFSIYGDKLAIVLSSVAFGLFHGNFEQLFYTASVGLIWGYVYTKSGRLRYSVIMHMLMNFLGGFLPLYIVDAPEISSVFGMIGLLALQYGGALAGFVLFIVAIVKKWYTVKSKPEIYIPKKHLPRFLVFNLGSLIFLIWCVCEFILNHSPSILEAL